MYFLEKERHQFLINNIGKSSDFQIGSSELQVLLQVVKYRIVLTETVHTYFKKLAELDNCNLDEIELLNKMKEFVYSGLLEHVSYNSNTRSSEDLKGYTYTKKTLELLYKEGLLREADKAHYLSVLKADNPNVSCDEISQLGINLELMFRQKYKDIRFEITLQRYTSLCLEINLVELKKIIIVDIIDITKSLDDVLNKYKKYNELAQSLLETSLDILFIPLPTMSDIQLTDSDIRNVLQKNIPYYKDWVENLNLYILSYGQLTQYLNEIFSSTQFRESYNRYKNFLNTRNVKMQQINVNDEVLMLNDNERFHKELLCLKNKTLKEVFQLFVPLRTGSVADYQAAEKIINSMMAYAKDFTLILVYNSVATANELKSITTSFLNVHAICIDELKDETSCEKLYLQMSKKH